LHYKLNIHFDILTKTMARRTSGEFSAASMADIAFLLLIFFLVATTMDIDTGMYRVCLPNQINHLLK